MDLSLIPAARTRQRRALTIEKTDVKSRLARNSARLAPDSRAKNDNAAGLAHRPMLKSTAASERKS